MTLIVDKTRSGVTTGVERVAAEVFNARALAGIEVREFRARGTLGMVAGQWIGLPLAAIARPGALIACPSFPPSIALALTARNRVIHYVHDLFLLDRIEDLNVRAKLYMRPSFAFSLRAVRNFVVNSEYTRSLLASRVHPRASIELLRPAVRNVFGVTPELRRSSEDGEFRVLMIGTVEPRKNYPAAVEICRRLRAQLGRPVILDVVGRAGWGDDIDLLRSAPDVRLHGYLEEGDVRERLAGADILLATSKDEGLGLPLLEAQHGGLPVVAADIAPFAEVLGGSGLLVDCSAPAEAAAQIAASVSRPGWREEQMRRAAHNLARWNALAAADLERFRAWLLARGARPSAA